MFMHDIVRILMRRWLWAPVAVALSLWCCALAADAVAPTYVSRATVVLVPPQSTVNPPTQDGTQGPPGNPYLYLGGLDQALAVVVRSVDSDETREAVAAKAGGDFEITPDYTTSAPLLVVKVEATTTAKTTKLLAVVLGQIPTSLAGLQTRLQVPDTSQITTFVVSSTPSPVVDRKLQLRVIAVAGVGSFGLLLLLIAAADGALLRRRARAAVASVEAPPAATSEPAPQQPEPALTPTPTPALEEGDKEEEEEDDEDQDEDASELSREPANQPTALVVGFRSGRSTQHTDSSDLPTAAGT